MEPTRRMLLCSAAVAALGGGACGKARSKPPSEAAFAPRAAMPPAAQTTLIGYGLVNKWFAIDAERLAGVLQENGCTFTELEYIAWFDESGPKGTSIRHDAAAAARVVTVMRRNAITTLISAVNWNGAAQRAQGDSWYYALILEITERVGPDRVLLLPVSEPDATGKSLHWQQYAKERWPGALVLNGPGGRGDPVISGADFTDWHWCQDFDASDCKPPPYLNNTDCGPVLNPGPQRAHRMALAALATGAHFHVYDHGGETISEPTIEALGSAIRQHGSGEGAGALLRPP